LAGETIFGKWRKTIPGETLAKRRNSGETSGNIETPGESQNSVKIKPSKTLKKTEP
ncbi:15_t:CDS:1, partial [Ambispora leptoticha]